MQKDDDILLLSRYLIEENNSDSEYFVLDKESQGSMSFAARVVDPKSGRQMDIFTEEPGMQFYGGNFMDGSDVGKYGTKFEYRASFALETQHYPDSPNQPKFPSTILNPGDTYQTKSIYKFSNSK